MAKYSILIYIIYKKNKIMDISKIRQRQVEDIGWTTFMERIYHFMKQYRIDNFYISNDEKYGSATRKHIIGADQLKQILNYPPVEIKNHPNFEGEDPSGYFVICKKKVFVDYRRESGLFEIHMSI